MQRILLGFGTRPEAIKMAPVVKALQARPDLFKVAVCVTAQHRAMLDQVLEHFEIQPDYDLNLMAPGQDLTDVTVRILSGMREVLKKFRPDRVLVHGDTATTLGVSLAAYYQRIPVGHVEAGLRTRNIYSPWPEELNRKIAGSIADLHFAPSPGAKKNLLDECVKPDSVIVTGNTGIDALLMTVEKIRKSPTLKSRLEAEFSFLNPSKRLILVTGHRRENFGEGFLGICNALKMLASEHEDIEILYPVHLNPNVQEPVNRLLRNSQAGWAGRIHLIDPVSYVPFVYLMGRAHLIITDSGGIQEEAPGLAKPFLVMRDTTERPEVIQAGCGKLVGTDPLRIFREATELLLDPAAYQAMASGSNPYGDGSASARIVEALELEWLRRFAKGLDVETAVPIDLLQHGDKGREGTSERVSA